MAAGSGRPALFLVPHPDDETLAAGVLLAWQAAAGSEVHILLLTRGEKSAVRDVLNGVRTSGWWGVPHDPRVEGYAPLTERTLGAVRYRELVAAAGALGVTEDRIHEAGLPNDGITVEDVRAAVAATADAIGGEMDLWAPSYTVDNHPDHLAAGEAARQLGLDVPIRWGNRRYYVLPPYWSDPRWARSTGAGRTRRIRRPPRGPATPAGRTAPGSRTPGCSPAAITRCTPCSDISTRTREA